nr:unnamed protein product [Salmo salar]|eukprot:XP_014009355.1 PREDICTED: TBC1 domain family member 17-like [Salmo salar]
MKLDITAILNKAEAICLQLKSCKDLPNSVVEILGFNSTDTESSSQSEDTERMDRPDSPEPSTPSDDQQDLVSDYSPSGDNRHLKDAARDVYKLAYIS